MHDFDEESFVKSFQLNPEQFDSVLSILQERLCGDDTVSFCIWDYICWCWMILMSRWTVDNMLKRCETGLHSFFVFNSTYGPREGEVSRCFEHVHWWTTAKQHATSALHVYWYVETERVLLSFCVQEHKKILFYYPTDVELDTKIRQIGLCEAVTKFTRCVMFVVLFIEQSFHLVLPVFLLWLIGLCAQKYMYTKYFCMIGLCTHFCKSISQSGRF